MAPRKRRSAAGRPHLVLRLKQGWSYNARPRRFVAADDHSFDPKADLPKYTRIRYQVPALAKKRKRTRTPDEDALARGIQIIPPKNVRPERLLQSLQSWPCVEQVWVSPAPAPAARVPGRVYTKY